MPLLRYFVVNFYGNIAENEYIFDLNLKLFSIYDIIFFSMNIISGGVLR